MTFSDHWKELRRRLCYVVILFLVLFLVVYAKGTDVFDTVLRTGREAGYNFAWIAPQDVLVQQIRLDMAIAGVCCMPFLIFQIILFVAPAFDSKKIVAVFIVCELCILGMFAGGIVFAVEVLLPFVFEYLHGLVVATNVASQISVSEYVSFIITVTVVLGCIAELPFVCSVLVKVGAVTPESLRKGRVVVLVMALLVGAVITPPDVVSQCIVGIPIYLLYELSIVISSVVYRLGKRGNKA